MKFVLGKYDECFLNKFFKNVIDNEFVSHKKTNN